MECEGSAVDIDSEAVDSYRPGVVCGPETCEEDGPKVVDSILPVEKIGPDSVDIIRPVV